MKIIKNLIILTILSINVYSYQNITKEQIENNNKLIVVMYSEKCEWCKWFDKKVLKNNEFEKLIKKNKINLIKLEEIKSSYPRRILNNKAIPYIFLIKDGIKKWESNGYLSPQTINKKIKEVYN